jgi:hypothetical protein
VADAGSFIIPVSGYTASPYAWDIDWGDNSALQYATGSARNGSYGPGISHRYTDAGTYTITITPHNAVAFGWARAFGFSPGSTQSDASTNKDKLVEVLSLPMKGLLQSATQTGDNFMRNMFYRCYNLRSVAFNDPFSYQITSIGNAFLYNTWWQCRGLTVADVPNTSVWRPVSLGNDFCYYTWYLCESLPTAVMFDTSGWAPTSLGSNLFFFTWYDCSALTSAPAPNTSLWKSTPIAAGFFQGTWRGCARLTVAPVPDFSGWEFAGPIGDYFLSQTWSGCTSLLSAATPDLSGWRPTSIGNRFISSTWSGCSLLTTAPFPDTTGWSITGTVGTEFLSYVFFNCRGIKDLSSIVLSNSFNIPSFYEVTVPISGGRGLGKDDQRVK